MHKNSYFSIKPKRKPQMSHRSRAPVSQQTIRTFVQWTEAQRSKDKIAAARLEAMLSSAGYEAQIVDHQGAGVRSFILRRAGE